MEMSTYRPDEATQFGRTTGSDVATIIPRLIQDLESDNSNLHIPALRLLLEIILDNRENKDLAQKFNLMTFLNKFTGNVEKNEEFVLSTTISHVIGVRNGSDDETILAGAATESLIQIIHSPDEKISKSGSKALCELVEENSEIRNSLLSTGFAQLVLHTLTSNTQIETKSSSYSSPENSTPIFIKIGLLNVVKKLTEDEKGLESLIVLIPVLEELKSDEENQLKSKAKNLLLILSQIKGINSQYSNFNETDLKIQQLEESNKLKDEELLKIRDEKDKEQQRKDAEINKLKDENKKIKAENDLMKKEIEKLIPKQEPEKLISKSTQDFPISVINNDPPEIVFSDVDGVMKKISKKNEGFATVSLTQILENGIWQMEAEFSKSSQNWAAIGIVRDTYNIPADTHPCHNPHCQHMVSYGMCRFGEGFGGNGKLFYKRNGTPGNIAYKDNQNIKAEFDSEKGTLIFSVDGVQQPVYVIGLNEKVRFFITIGNSLQYCTIRSLKKLATPTIGHVANEKAVHW